MIDQVWKFANGNVAVFDEAGEQMGDYQHGGYTEAREKILRDAPIGCRFYSCGTLWKGKVEISRNEF